MPPGAPEARWDASSMEERCVWVGWVMEGARADGLRSPTLGGCESRAISVPADLAYYTECTALPGRTGLGGCRSALSGGCQCPAPEWS